MLEKIKTYDILILGNYTKDTIVSASGTRVVDGGGFNYGAHVAAMMGLNAATVTHLSEEDSHVIDSLKQIGVDVFPHFTPESTCLRIEYLSSNVDERVFYVTSTAGAFSPSEFENLNARAILINASMRGEVNLEVIQYLSKKKARLAADVQGFVRVHQAGKMVYEAWPEKHQILGYIDVLKTDAVEAEMLTGETDIKAAAKMIYDLGPEEIVLTHRDGVLVYADNQFFDATFFPEKLVGRSGRGDTCVASYMAKRLSASPAVATIWAAAVTSLKMEAEGPVKRKASEVENLIRYKYKVQK